MGSNDELDRYERIASAFAPARRASQPEALSTRVLAFVTATASAAWRHLREAHERRCTLRALEQLSAWQMKDIGVTREDLAALADGRYSENMLRRLRPEDEPVCLKHALPRQVCPVCAP